MDATMNLANQQRPPSTGGREALLDKFPEGKTPTGQDVAAAATPEEAARHAVQMGLPEKAQPHFASYMVKMLPVYGALAAVHLATGDPLGFAGHMVEIGTVAAGTIGADKILRRGLAHTLERPKEAAALVAATLNPGAESSLRIIARSVANSALKVGADQWLGSRRMMPPPPPPEAPLPETPKKARIDAVKEIRAGIQEGGEPVNVTTDLHAGRFTIDDLREQLAPPMPGG